MTKVLRLFVYMVGCVAVFFVIVNIQKEKTLPKQASAFEWEKPVTVYFLDPEMVDNKSCEATVGVQRSVLNAETLGPGALQALLDGLNVEEEAHYFSAINPKTLVQKFEIINGTAFVDFDSGLNSGVAGSCKVGAIRSQIEKTLTSLPDIHDVVISVNGQTEGVLEP